MANTQAKAAEWINRLASHPSVPFGRRLREHFAAAQITRLCDCGCNSFDLQIPEGIQLDPLCAPLPDLKGHSMFFEIVFASDSEAEIDCMLFADSRGYLASVDVMHGQANHLPMPESVQLLEVKLVDSHAL